MYSYVGAPTVVVVYEGRMTGGTLTTCHENDCVEWVDLDAIPWDDLAFPSTIAALREYLRAGG